MTLSEISLWFENKQKTNHSFTGLWFVMGNSTIACLSGPDRLSIDAHIQPKNVCVHQLFKNKINNLLDSLQVCKAYLNVCDAFLVKFHA